MKLTTSLVLGGLLMAMPRLAHAEFPTLDVAIQRARTHAIAVHEAEAELAASRGQLAGARVSSLSNPYSEIQVDRPFTDGARTGDSGRQVQAMTFNYFPLDIAGQRGKRIEEAERLIDWRKLGIVDARAIATGEIVSAYGDFVVSWARVEAAVIGETTAREEAKYFQGRFEARDTTLYEKSISEAEVARWVQSRAEAELRIANARARYGQLTNTFTLDKPPPNTPVMPPTLRANWEDDMFIARVIDKSPLVQKFAGEKTYWEASIARYEREKIPPVAFEIIAGRGGAGETRLGAGAVITFPITRRYQAEIARAEAGRTTAIKHVEIYKGIIQTRLRAARDAIKSVSTALAELDKNGIPALERAVQASEEGFRLGKIDLTRAMLARRDLAIARARRLDLVEAQWRAYADLATFSGDLP